MFVVIFVTLIFLSIFFKENKVTTFENFAGSPATVIQLGAGNGYRTYWKHGFSLQPEDQMYHSFNYPYNTVWRMAYDPLRKHPTHYKYPNPSNVYQPDGLFYDTRPKVPFILGTFIKNDRAP